MYKSFLLNNSKENNGQSIVFFSTIRFTSYKPNFNKNLKIYLFSSFRLPGEEALLENGTKDGQTRMIKVENKVIAYCWSMSEGKWKMIGDVVGSNNNNKAGETGKQFYNGKVLGSV